MASDTPTWLVELHSQALKDCPSFSLSNEFRKINGAMTRGEDPLKTIYNLSDAEIEELPITKRVQGIQLQTTEDRISPSAHETQRPEVPDSKQLAKLQKRKASTQSAGKPITMPRKVLKGSESSFAPAEAPIAESSKAGAARKSPPSFDTPVAADWSAQVPKSEVETNYEVKELPKWYVSTSFPTCDGT